MRPSHWPIPPVEPCDAIALDGIEDLSEADLDALTAGPPADTTGRADSNRLRRIGTPGWRHHIPTPGIPAFHLLPCR